MSTITKEFAQDIIRGHGYGVAPSAVEALARIALASLEAEPVCVIDQTNLDYLKSGADADVWPASRTEMGDVLLYRSAPPAPVEIADLQRKAAIHDALCEKYNVESLADFVDWQRNHIAELEAAPPAPVGEGETAVMPDYPGYVMTQRECFQAGVKVGMERSAPVLQVWYGAMPETNGKTNWTAMLHRKGQHLWEGITIDRSEYPDRVRYEADRMRHLIGELADEPDILAYDAEAHSGYVYPGNSSVIPDGWVACSERMPETDGNYWGWWSESKRQGPVWFIKSELQAQFQSSEITHWMPLPAAPQQEVK